MRIQSAQNNVFVGHQAGDQVTDGNTNVIIGSFAGGAITVHDDNVIIGKAVDRYHTDWRFGERENRKHFTDITG